MKHRLAHEIAEASRADDRAKFGSTRHTDVLLQTAKALERAQARRRRLRKDLKVAEDEIRRLKREIKALAQTIGRGKDEDV